MGMRQKSLLGKYLRYYDPNFSLYDGPDYKKGALNNPGLLDEATQIYVEGTNFWRTLQSAYSELSGLLGMWEGKGKIRELKPNELKSIKRVDTIPFKIRRRDRLNEVLQNKAIVDGFIPVPVYQSILRYENVFVGAHGGGFAHEQMKQGFKDDAGYVEHLEHVGQLEELVGEALNLTKE